MTRRITGGLKLCATSSVRSWAAWTAHALPSTSRPHSVQLVRDSASALPCRRPARCSTSKSSSARLSSHRATCPSGSLKMVNQRRQLWSVRTRNR
ncbi:hypothetical protein T12_821 [Trichinella patagoniensis]|uniref:Uncharacterized protein n=1 Tax=Trichinella patagoniensis TaxID=990121 RepID=A0A0V1AGQ6_9BILA|nr:hypothetical protein T12_821 [Trichinella patagoniensis]